MDSDLRMTSLLETSATVAFVPIKNTAGEDIEMYQQVMSAIKSLEEKIENERQATQVQLAEVRSKYPCRYIW